ncbi:MAG: hypothetical protein EOP06_01820, partial [Proteobacteria bacterium]
MITANYSEGEINAAREAAAARGEDLFLVPRSSPTVKRVGELSTVAELYALRVLNPKINKGKNTDRELARYVELDNKTNAARKGLPASADFLSEELGRTLAELSTKNVRITSLIISGHDGGGKYGGTFGSIDFAAITKFAASYPGFKTGLRSVYLLGCYTSTPFEVRNWKAGFENLKVVAGAEQKGLLRTDPRGWAWLSEAMLKEREFLKATDARELNQVIASTLKLNAFASGIAVFADCANGEKEFYRSQSTQNLFAQHSPNFCEKSVPAFLKNNSATLAFSDGRSPIPENTAQSELRELYTFYRLHEQCNT